MHTALYGLPFNFLFSFSSCNFLSCDSATMSFSIIDYGKCFLLLNINMGWRLFWVGNIFGWIIFWETGLMWLDMFGLFRFLPSLFLLKETYGVEFATQSRSLVSWFKNVLWYMNFSCTETVFCTLSYVHLNFPLAIFMSSVLVNQLCSVKHLEVQTKAELHDALFSSQAEEDDCVIEVSSSIDANATFHRLLVMLLFDIIFISAVSSCIDCRKIVLLISVLWGNSHAKWQMTLSGSF